MWYNQLLYLQQGPLQIYIIGNQLSTDWRSPGVGSKVLTQKFAVNWRQHIYCIRTHRTSLKIGYTMKVDFNLVNYLWTLSNKWYSKDVANMFPASVASAVLRAAPETSPRRSNRLLPLPAPPPPPPHAHVPAAERVPFASDKWTIDLRAVTDERTDRRIELILNGATVKIRPTYIAGRPLPSCCHLRRRLLAFCRQRQHVPPSWPGLIKSGFLCPVGPPPLTGWYPPPFAGKSPAVEGAVGHSLLPTFR